MPNQATEFLPAPSLRRILHLQDELVSRSSDSAGRTLLSSHFSPSPSGTGTPRHGKEASRNGATSGSAATDLLLGMTGRNKLIAAGDRLRELIIPDALAQAVSVVGAGVGVTSGGGTGSGKKGLKKRDKLADEGRIEELRKELDELVAGQCPLCEGAVVGLDKPFIVSGEDTTDWEV